MIKTQIKTNEPIYISFSTKRGKTEMHCLVTYCSQYWLWQWEKCIKQIKMYRENILKAWKSCQSMKKSCLYPFFLFLPFLSHPLSAYMKLAVIVQTWMTELEFELLISSLSILQQHTEANSLSTAPFFMKTYRNKSERGLNLRNVKDTLLKVLLNLAPTTRDQLMLGRKSSM